MAGGHVHLDLWTPHPPWVARAVDSFTAEAPGERTFMSPLIVVDAWPVTPTSDI